MHEVWIIKRLSWKKKFSVNHVHIFKDKTIYNKDIKMSLLFVMNNQNIRVIYTRPKQLQETKFCYIYVLRIFEFYNLLI